MRASIQHFGTIYGQRGASLLEVLVASFVLALGIIGVTLMQSRSLSHNNKSIYRMQASYLSYQILDRIRANPAGDYTSAIDDAPAAVNCQSNTCSVADMARYDLADWKCALGKYSATSACDGLRPGGEIGAQQAILPEGDGAIDCQPAGNTRQCRITVIWTEPGAIKGKTGTETIEVVSLI